MFKTLSTEKISELDLIYYEIWMLNQLVNDHSLENASQCLYNAALESFLIHARNLIRFLEGDLASKDNKDDLTCARFRDSRGHLISRIPVMLPQKLKEKINKHLSHLTVVSTREKLEWDCEAIRKSVNHSLKDFFRTVSPDYFPTLEGKDREAFENLMVIPDTPGCH